MKKGNFLRIGHYPVTVEIRCEGKDYYTVIEQHYRSGELKGRPTTKSVFESFNKAKKNMIQRMKNNNIKIDNTGFNFA